MKKLIKVMAVVLFMAGCGRGTMPQESPETTGKAGYTFTNSVQLETKPADMSGYHWLYDPSPAFAEISFADSVRMFTENGTGILYYGRTNCPWCQRAVPILDEAAQEAGLTVYYIDATVPIALKEDGEVDQQKSTEIYNQLVDQIKEILPQDENGNYNFQIPEVIAVKDGKIVGHHLSLVDDFTLTDEEAQMSEEQQAELKKIYAEMIRSIAD